MSQKSPVIDLSSLSQYTPSIQIDISEPGIYAFSNLDSCGKTYLASLLNKLRNRERVDSYAYPAPFDPAKLLDPEKRDLVMLDRYDMYAGQGAEEILAFAQSGIVLIDYKNYPIQCFHRSCRLRMYQDRLVVKGGRY